MRIIPTLSDLNINLRIQAHLRLVLFGWGLSMWARVVSNLWSSCPEPLSVQLATLICWCAIYCSHRASAELSNDKSKHDQESLKHWLSGLSQKRSTSLVQRQEGLSLLGKFMGFHSVCCWRELRSNFFQPFSLKLTSNLGTGWLGLICLLCNQSNIHVPHHWDSTVGGEEAQYPTH